MTIGPLGDGESGNEMSERPVELQAILTDVRRRWTLRSLLRAWTLGAAAAALIRRGRLRRHPARGARRPSAGVHRPSSSVSFVGAILVYTLWPFRRRPTDSQIARLIEEHTELDDVVVTAVDYAARPDAQSAHDRRAGGRCCSGPGGSRPRRDRVARVDPRACAEGWRRDSCARTGRGAVLPAVLARDERRRRVSVSRPAACRGHAGHDQATSRRAGDDHCASRGIRGRVDPDADHRGWHRVSRRFECSLPQPPGVFAVTLDEVTRVVQLSRSAAVGARRRTSMLPSSARRASSASTCTTSFPRVLASSREPTKTAATSTVRQARRFGSM